MSPTLRRAAGALLVAATLQGCALNFDARSLGVPVTMASPENKPAPGDHFRVTSRAIYAFWGVMRLKEPSLERALATQLVGGHGVADLKIGVRSKFGDVLLTILTGGLIAPRAVTFEGVIVGNPPAAPTDSTAPSR